jgi:hypothetical protein
MIPVLYLHGFASSPESRKATFFRERLGAEGVPLKIPDMAAGDFRNLTLTGQLRLVEGEARGEPVFLIGSSMGGYLAALYAAEHPEVAGLILLAPAFRFHARWAEILGPERLVEWKKAGELPVYHYGEGREVPLGYQFIEDAKLYEDFPRFQQPCLLFHGSNDTVVPIQYSEEFARQNGNVEFVRLQSGHELTDVLGTIWAQAGPKLLSAIGR